MINEIKKLWCARRKTEAVLAYAILLVALASFGIAGYVLWGFLLQALASYPVVTFFATQAVILSAFGFFAIVHRACK